MPFFCFSYFLSVLRSFTFTFSLMTAVLFRWYDFMLLSCNSYLFSLLFYFFSLLMHSIFLNIPWNFIEKQREQKEFPCSQREGKEERKKNWKKKKRQSILSVWGWDERRKEGRTERWNDSVSHSTPFWFSSSSLHAVVVLSRFISCTLFLSVSHISHLIESHFTPRAWFNTNALFIPLTLFFVDCISWPSSEDTEAYEVFFVAVHETFDSVTKGDEHEQHKLLPEKKRERGGKQRATPFRFNYWFLFHFLLPSFLFFCSLTQVSSLKRLLAI